MGKYMHDIHETTYNRCLPCAVEVWFLAQLLRPVYLGVDHDVSTLVLEKGGWISPYKPPKLNQGQQHSLQQKEDLFLLFLSDP